MLGYVPFPTVTAEPYQLTLAPYSFLWLELQTPSSDAKTLPEPQLVPVADTTGTEAPLVDFATAGWSGLLTASGLAQIESALPAWLSRQRWFGAKSRRIQSARVRQWADLSVVESDIKDLVPGERSEAAPGPPAIFFVEVSYFDGEPDTYQLPLAISTGNQADAVTSERPDSILTTLTSVSGVAVLHDAAAREDFRRMELMMIERNASVPLTSMLLSGWTQGSQISEIEVDRPGASSLDEKSTAKARANHSTNSLPVQPLPLYAQPGASRIRAASR